MERIALPAPVTWRYEESSGENAEAGKAVLPSTLLSIGDDCFEGCKSLSKVFIPDSVEAMGMDCFQDCASDILILTKPGSKAMQWAHDNQVDYQADTHYRALLIAQTYKDCVRYPHLDGPEADVEIMENCLSAQAGTNFEVTVRYDLSASGILEAIQSCFGMAQDQDVSLFFYSGHGQFSNDAAQQGALVGADGNGSVRASELRQALDQIPGRKIIILDSCYSGTIISGETPVLLRAEGIREEKTARDFLDSFTAAFTMKSRSSSYYSQYFMLTSAAENEECFEDRIGGRSAGLFTANLAKGLGYNSWNNTFEEMAADVNQNGVVTFQEAYQYARERLIAEGQHAQVYPAGCDWFGLIRAE